MLKGDWPAGAAVIPAGTIIGDDGLPPPSVPLPIVAMALDDDAALQMCMWHEESNTIGGWHEIHFAPGIDREAIFAKARHQKRWPNGEPTPSASPSPTPTKKRSSAKGV
jgi:hypothetical protein